MQHCEKCNKLTKEKYCEVCKTHAQVSSAKNPLAGKDSKQVKEEVVLARAKALLKAAMQFEGASEVMECMIYVQHGGIKKFCEDWYMHVKALAEEKPGSKAALDYHQNMLRMMLQFGSQVKPDLDIDEMDLAAIESELQKYKVFNDDEDAA